jgi:hypothetical protein
MKKRFLMIALGLLITGVVSAQDYKIAKSTGTLEIIEVNNVSIEGSSGNEIVFTSHNRDRDEDDRAKGLRAVSSMGLEDNTGLGLSVQDKGTVIEVRQLKKVDGPEITIKVPKGVVVSFKHSSPYGSGVSFKNMENEINVSTVHNEVELENVSGPMSVKTVHGEINASFGTNIKGPITIASVHGHVDVGIPATTKANLKLSTSWGELLLDPELKVEMDKKGNMVEYSDNFSGKMNGGGIDIDLSSTHNNVYLRKK